MFTTVIGTVVGNALLFIPMGKILACLLVKCAMKITIFVPFLFVYRLSERLKTYLVFCSHWNEITVPILYCATLVYVSIRP